MNWFYSKDGQQAGPVADEELAGLVRNGSIQPSTLVWHSGLAGWQPFSEVNAAQPVVPVGTGAVVGAGEALCSECGRVFPADEVVQVNGHNVCARCKPLFLQKMQQGVADVGLYGLPTVQYAGFWIRFGAAILDGLILMPFSFLLNFLFTSMFKGALEVNAAGAAGPQFDSAFFVRLGIYYLVIFTLTSIYNGVCLSRFGGMPGMLICGLRVTRPDGQRISFLRGVARYFANILSGLMLFMGYLFIVFDDQKRALHDYICDTRVRYK